MWNQRIRKGAPGNLGVSPLSSLNVGGWLSSKEKGLVQRHVAATAGVETVRFFVLKEALQCENKAGETLRGRVGCRGPERDGLGEL